MVEQKVAAGAGGGSAIGTGTGAGAGAGATVSVATIAAFTKRFADYYGADNIRMNGVLPGFIDSLPENVERRARISMRRYGTVEEMAALVLYLATDRSRYVTGRNIRIDAESRGRFEGSSQAG